MYVYKNLEYNYIKNLNKKCILILLNNNGAQCKFQKYHYKSRNVRLLAK